MSTFAPVVDARPRPAPLLARDTDSEPWLIGLRGGKQRLGDSVLAQVHADGGLPGPPACVRRAGAGSVTQPVQRGQLGAVAR
nr:hypothetical protein [Xanthomonas sp.]